jgi:hypothetical protein
MVGRDPTPSVCPLGHLEETATVGGVGDHRVGAEVKKEGRFDTFLEGQAVDF